MSAQRKIIRKACAEWLKKSRLVPAANIFASRSKPLSSQYECPALCVYGSRENITLWQESPRLYKRELELRIELVCQNGDADDPQDEVDDQLDDISAEIEKIIGRSDRLTYQKAPQVSDILLAGDQLDFDAQGEKIIGTLTKTYTAIYYTPEPDDDDENPVDDIEQIGTEYNLKGEQDAADRAADLIELNP